MNNEPNNFNNNLLNSGNNNNNNVGMESFVQQPAASQPVVQQSFVEQPVLHQNIGNNTNNFEVSHVMNDKAKNNKKILVIVGIILLIILCILAFVLLNGNSKNDSKKEENKQNEVVKKEDKITGRYKYIDSFTTNSGQLVTLFANDEEKMVSFEGYYDMDSDFYFNVNCARNANYEYSLIDINKNEIVKSGVYKYIGRISEIYFAATNTDDKRGVIDYRGNVILPFKYRSISYRKDDYSHIEYFIVQKYNDDKYYMVSSEGKEVFTFDEDPYYSDIKVYRAINSKDVDSFLYDNKVYSMKDGKMLLEPDLENGSYYNHVYYDWIEQKAYIYDENYKLKKDNYLDVFDFRYSEEYGCILRDIDNNSYYLNEKFEFEKIKDDEKNENDDNAPKGFTEVEGGQYHTLADGSKMITKIDYDNNILYFYDGDANELKAMEIADASMIKSISVAGNYLNVVYGFSSYSNLFNSKADFVIESASYLSKNDMNSLIMASLYDEKILLGDDFQLSLPYDVSSYYCSKGVFIFYKYEHKVELYDLSGNIINTYENVNYVWNLTDNYFLFEGTDNVYKVIGSETTEITLEYTKDLNDYFYVPYSYLEDNIGIIETSDGYYNLNGKMLYKKEV